MEVLHQAEQPGALVFARLLEALHHTDLLSRIADAVALHAIVGHLALLGCQPGGRQRSVRKQEEAKDGYKGCYCALTDAR